jgi:hypothetical protein
MPCDAVSIVCVGMVCRHADVHMFRFIHECCCEHVRFQEWNKLRCRKNVRCLFR